MIVTIWIETATSNKKFIFDLDTKEGEKQLGYGKDEWEEMDNAEKNDVAHQVMLNYVNYGYFEE